MVCCSRIPGMGCGRVSRGMFYWLLENRGALASGGERMRLFLLGLACVGGATAAGADSPATFDKDVLPVLQKNCQSCHRLGEVAPMSFMTYQDTRPWAKAIKAAVLSKKMPPWFADPKFGHFQNERRLTEAEVNALVNWADGGAPEGDAEDKPTPLQFLEGW